MPTALVTGGNRGIGKEVCRQLALKGFTVILAARDEAAGKAAAEELIKGGAAKIDTLQLDVTNDDSVNAAFKTVEKKYASIDLLVNNAGANPGYFPIESVPFDEFDKCMQINLYGPIRVMKSFLPLLKKAPSARIVNVSSILGSLNSHQNPESTIYGQTACTMYNSSKAALNMYTVNLAHELAKNTKVSVFSAHPGWVQTDMGGANAPLTVEQGANNIIQVCLMSADTPTGGFYFGKEKLPW